MDKSLEEIIADMQSENQALLADGKQLKYSDDDFAGVTAEYKSKEDDIYKILSINEYVKKSLDEHLIYKDKNKDKTKLTFDEWKTLLFEYCDKNEMTPLNRTKYKDQNIGLWLQNQKVNINSNDDELYKILSTNKYVKKSFDEYLIYKIKNKDKIKLTFDELKKLLFEYCNNNKKFPLATTKSKNKNIGTWFHNQKSKINSQDTELYKVLSSNKYVKESLDNYLIYKNKKERDISE